MEDYFHLNSDITVQLKLVLKIEYKGKHLMQIKRTYKVIRVLCLKATHTLYKILRYSCICFKKLTTCECFYYFYRPEVCFIFKNLGMSIFKEKVLAIEIWIFFTKLYITDTCSENAFKNYYNLLFIFAREEFVQIQCCANRVELGQYIINIRSDEFLHIKPCFHDCF